MSKTKAAEETTAKETVETAAEETVTVSKSEFEMLLADMKLMKQRLADEDRQRELKNKKALEDEESIKRLEEANAKAEELVPLHVELGGLGANKNVEVAINGVQYIVPRGENVMVPRKVKEVIDNSAIQREKAYGLQDRRAEEAKRSGVS